MAAYHARSNSLPSTQHPIVSQFEHSLCRLRSNSEATSTSSSSIGNQLNDLQDLLDRVDELLLLPSSHQASFDGLADGSLRLLDVCSLIKGALSQTKDSVQEIQSVIRRRCEARSDINKFFSTRKAVQRTILKALKSLKDIGNKSSDDETVALLEQAQAHTVLVLESLLSFTSGKKSCSRSLVSKLLRPNRVSCKQEEANEFTVVDASLQSLIHCKGSAVNAQNQLQKLDACIQDFEDSLESLFRGLLKNRVSLLNIINH